MKYDHKKIEEKWMRVWEEKKLFRGTVARESEKDPAAAKADQTSLSALSDREKMYLLFAFAYPSGEGLHVGHVEAKAALDILARFYRMQGKRVFLPVGWDAFGLPAENYAVKTGVPPAETTKKAIENFKKQIKRIGISYDWEAEISTAHPGYYKWTQWLFVKLYEQGLAYQAEGKVNWCPSCQTVLANEQVVNGRCERCDSEVVQKKLKQWYFRITDYVDELVEGLEQVDWPEATKRHQLDWIGRKKGVKIRFKVVGGVKWEIEAEAFTTRVDTVYGATFLVIAPEVASKWKAKGWDMPARVAAYVESANLKTEEERKIGEKEKTGVATGLVAINPVNGEEVPVYVADYVLAEYGTGVVMGVPGHDERDYAFAKAHAIEVVQVIGQLTGAYRSYLMGADEISDEELEKIHVVIEDRKENGSRLLTIPEGSLAAYENLVTKKLRSGYWNEVVGKDVIFIFKSSEGEVARLELDRETEGEIQKRADNLMDKDWTPMQSVWGWLAENEWYRPVVASSEYGVLVNSSEFSGMSSEEAMEKIPAAFAEVMEKTVMYRLRDWLISRQRYWGAPMPIVYDPEGKAHVVKEEHLPWLLPTDVEFKPTGESPLRESKEFQERVERLYGKGWTPEYDTLDTFVDSAWYFLRYVDARNEEKIFEEEKVRAWLPVDMYMIGPEHIVLHLLYARFITKFLRDQGYLNFDEPFAKMRHQGMILGPDNKKMSKSKGNVINPDEIVEKYGADTLRVYEMFMGPLEADKPWNPRAVSGVERFLKRFWKLIVSDAVAEIDQDFEQALHRVCKQMSEQLPQLKFNTAIAALMELVTLGLSKKGITKEQKRMMVRMLAPLAPFMTEELWWELEGSKDDVGGFQSVHEQEWPRWDQAKLVTKKVLVVMQVNGKKRGEVKIEKAKLAEWEAGKRAEEELVSLMRDHDQVGGWLKDKELAKVIWVAPKGQRQGLVNVVVR